MSHVGSPANATVAGLEGTYTSYERDQMLKAGPGLGAFALIEFVDFDHLRFALGPQVNVLFVGTELGIALETAGDDGHGPTLFLHAGPFVSLGFLSATGRFDPPIASWGSKPAYRFGYGAHFALKYVGEVKNGRLDGTFLGIR